jgi:hypothetical protein
MTSAPFTRPITGTPGPHPSRASESGANPITGSITGGITASRERPLHGDPSLSDGPREGRGLSIRVAVDLATYGRLAELSRGDGLTLEGAAARLLASAATRHELATHRYPITPETRWVMTPPTYLEGAGGPGSTSTPPANHGAAASQHPAPSSLRVEASPVRPIEKGSDDD